MNQMHSKVFKDYFSELFKWFLYLAIVSIIIRVANYLLVYYNQEKPTTTHFLEFTLDPMNIGMLVLGSIAVYAFLPQVIKFGATRKAFYKGMIYTAIALTVCYGVINLLLSVIEYNIIQSIDIEVITLTDVWSYLMALFLSFLAGMLITLGFYKYNWVVGVILIVATLVSLIILEAISLFATDLIAVTGFGFLVGSMGEYVFIALTLWLNYKLIKDVPIKM